MKVSDIIQSITMKIDDTKEVQKLIEEDSSIRFSLRTDASEMIIYFPNKEDNIFISLNQTEYKVLKKIFHDHAKSMMNALEIRGTLNFLTIMDAALNHAHNSESPVFMKEVYDEFKELIKKRLPAKGSFTGTFDFTFEHVLIMVNNEEIGLILSRDTEEIMKDIFRKKLVFNSRWELIQAVEEHYYMKFPDEKTVNDNLDKLNFEKELEGLLNKYSIDNKTETPDYILAEMIVHTLEHYGMAVKKNLLWRGINVPEPVEPIQIEIRED